MADDTDRPTNSSNQFPAVMTVGEAAKYVRLGVGTLNRFRVSGGGPRYAKLGGAVRYRKTDLDDWIMSRMVQSTSQAASSNPFPIKTWADANKAGLISTRIFNIVLNHFSEISRDTEISSVGALWESLTSSQKRRIPNLGIKTMWKLDDFFHDQKGAQ